MFPRCPKCNTPKQFFYDNVCTVCVNVPFPEHMPSLWRVCYNYATLKRQDPRDFEHAIIDMHVFGRKTRKEYPPSKEENLLMEKLWHILQD